jgi:hypothetical protein
MPGVAAQKTFQRQFSAFARAIFGDCALGVSGTTGEKTAMTSQNRAERQPVCGNQKQ